MTEGPISDKGAVNQEEGGHKALFAHVGVTDPADWRTVALRLASQYAPELLNGVVPATSVAAAKKAGRPEKWTPWHRTMLLAFIDMVKDASRAGLIRSDLVTNSAICRFIAGSYPETQWMRDALGLKEGTSPATLDNLRRLALKREEAEAANENTR